MIIPTHAAQTKHLASDLLKPRMRRGRSSLPATQGYPTPFQSAPVSFIRASENTVPATRLQNHPVHLVLETLELVPRNISPATHVDKVILPRAVWGNMQETRKCVSSTALLQWHEGESQRPLLSGEFLQTPSRYLAGEQD